MSYKHWAHIRLVLLNDCSPYEVFPALKCWRDSDAKQLMHLMARKRLDPLTTRTACEFTNSITFLKSLHLSHKAMKPYAVQHMTTAAIKSLLTHLCISVALNIIVHPQLTYEHQSPYHQRLYTQLCPAGQVPANPSQIQIFSQARCKLLAKG